jgi:hypothetical protein
MGSNTSLTVWICRRAMGKTWGINSRLVALWLYKAVLLPKLMYVSVVWWPVVSMVETRNLLQCLQGSDLRIVVRSMKMTPTEALEVALCDTPLDVAAIQAAGLTACRFKCQGEWRDIGVGDTKLSFLQKYPFTPNQDIILKKEC